jgi:hypothetical protein
MSDPIQVNDTQGEPMKMKIGATLFAAAAVGTMLAAPANAGTAEHCPAGGMKYEVNWGPDLYVGDFDGRVCIKTGTKAYFVDVEEGWVSSTVLNKPGNARLGISYIVFYDGSS